MAGQDPVVVNQYPEQLPPGNPRQSLPPADGGGKWIDPVLGDYVTDGTQGGGPRLRMNARVKTGIVPQRNHKVQKVT